jgi:hypothetical protein
MVHSAAVCAKHLCGCNTAGNRDAEIPSHALRGTATPIQAGRDVFPQAETRFDEPKQLAFYRSIETG